MFKIRALVTALALIGSISVATAWETLPTTAPAPADNPTTEEKIELGKTYTNEFAKKSKVLLKA